MSLDLGPGGLEHGRVGGHDAVGRHEDVGGRGGAAAGRGDGRRVRVVLDGELPHGHQRDGLFGPAVRFCTRDVAMFHWAPRQPELNFREPLRTNPPSTGVSTPEGVNPPEMRTSGVAKISFWSSSGNRVIIQALETQTLAIQLVKTSPRAISANTAA